MHSRAAQLQERAEAFAVYVVQFCNQLPQTTETRESADRLHELAQSVAND
jgi:hypothetical protein